MSTIIAQVEDPRINDIRSSVAQNSDAIPFLLLPVRTETRFMQVQKQSVQLVTTIESVLEGMAFVQIEAINTQNSLTGDNIRSLTTDIANLTTTVQALGNLLIKEKGWLKQLFNDTLKDVQLVVTASQNSLPPDSLKLNQTIAQLGNAVNETGIIDLSALEPARVLLDSFISIDLTLQILNGVNKKKVPYTDVKNKKDLYNYITKTLTDIKSFYQTVDEKTQALKYIDKTQRTRIVQLQADIQTQLSTEIVSLGKLHADIAWKKFTEKTVTDLVNDITTLSNTFAAGGLLSLNNLPGPPAMQTGDVFFSGIKALVKIKRFNADPKKGYNVIKKYKTYLEPRITTLAKTIQSPIIESQAGQIQKLQSLFGAINTEVQTSVTHINTYAAANKSQIAGQGLISNYFNNNVSTVIGGFAGGGGLNFPNPVYIPSPPQVVNQLWVRIYPDDIFVMTHEEALTANESAAGKQFWKAWWAAGGDKDLQSGAWQILCTALGSHRASWVARVLNPTTNPVNTAAFKTNPSSKIIDATNIVDAVNTAFKQLPLNASLTDVMNASAAQKILPGINTNLQKINKELALIKEEQDFLLDKFKSLFINTAGLFNQVINKSHQAPPSHTSAGIAFQHNLQAITIQLVNLQKAFNKIKSVTHKKFVDDIKDPFVYPAGITLKDNDWTTAPHANCLPDRFVVITMKGSQFTRIAVGNTVDAKLQLGLDPTKFDDLSLFTIDANGNMNIDDGLKWMTDYDIAVSKGMGITLDITDDEYNNGFDRLIVLGVKNTDASNSKQLFEQLITNHIYGVDGMNFLQVGTPTNNTHQAKSGYLSDDDTQTRYDIEIANIKYDANEKNVFNKTDGKYFCDALGVDNAVMQYANDSGNHEIANAYAANRALWGASLGHYMEEMWDGMFTYDNIRRTENFFTNYCFGRGVVPSIRVGMQPYGILTTTAFSQLQLYSSMPDLSLAEAQTILPWTVSSSSLENKLEQRFEMRLYNLLNMFQNTWTTLRNDNVIYQGNLDQAGKDPQQRFVQMLGLNATSLDYFYRYAINIAKGPNASADGFSTNFKSTDNFGPIGLNEIFKEQIKDGVFAPSFYNFDEDPTAMAGKTSWDVRNLMYSRILEQFNQSRLFVARLVENSLPVTGNLIDTIPESDSLLKGDYLSWLLTSGANAILGGNKVGDPTRIPFDTLLFVMLRQSLLQGYQEAALNMLQNESVIIETDRRSIGGTNRYHYKIPQDNKYVSKYLTKWHFLFKNLSDLVKDDALSSTVTGNPFYTFINSSPLSLANYLDRVKTNNPPLYNNSHKQFFNKLTNIRQSIETLKRASTSALDILMAEHVDLCTYRLDSWFLAFVVKRLQQQRTLQPNGLFLGAYGYVENLRRDKNKVEFKDAVLGNFKLDAKKPVYHDTNNQGFIHGPSIGQAIAAAVLRNAYMTNNTGEEDIANRLAVNISSARVRMAMQLVEGMRNGQELGAILGFQFERGLHDRYQVIELDKYIQPLRQAFPLQQKVDETAKGKPTYVSLVVNGSEILDKVYAAVSWLDYNNNTSKDDTIADLLKANNFAKVPTEISSVIDANLSGDNKTLVYNCIIEEIDRMADAFDALGDLSISESVYQMVQGNHVRAAAILTSLSEGKNIPDPEIIDTARSGIVVTQRIVLNFSPTNTATVSGWGNTGTVRSLTEPTFNKWLGETLGSSKNIKYVLKKTDVNKKVTKKSLSISTLNMQPIDFLLIPGAENELPEILINSFRQTNNDFISAYSIDIKEKDKTWGPDDKSLAEVYILVRHIRNMISNVKYSGDSDVRLPNDLVDGDNPGNWDVDELNKRVTGAHKSLQLFIQAVAAESFLTDVLSGKTPVTDVVLAAGDTGKIFDHLMIAVFLGIPHALSIPFDAKSSEAERETTLLQQLVNIYNQAVERESDATAAFAEIATISSIKLKVQKLVGANKTILGKNAIVNPLYKALNVVNIKTELELPGAQKIARNGGTLVIEDWLQNISKVRPRMYDLSMVAQTTDIYNLPFPAVEPAQLPYKPGDYWLGVEYPSSFTPPNHVVSLLLINAGQLPKPSVQSGFIIDEWIEMIPSKQQTTGITFNYNNPNASPPQSLLLAVTPQITNQWSWDDLVYTIVDTVELAKNRAVEPDHFDHSFLSQIVPGIFSEVVPPQFRNEDTNPLGVQVVMDLADVKLPKQN